MHELERLAIDDELQRLEDRWLDVLEHSFPADALASVIGTLVSRGHDEEARQLLELALDIVPAQPEEARRTFLWKASSSGLDSGRVRELLVEEIRDELLMYGPLEAFLSSSGLTGDAPLAEASSRMRELLRMQKGAWVRHRDFGAGRIDAVGRDSLTVSFGSRSSHRMTLRTVLETCAPLSPDSLGVLAMEDPCSIEELISRDPRAFLARAVDEAGGRLDRDSLNGLLADPGKTWRELLELARSSPGFEEIDGGIVDAGSPEDALEIVSGALLSSSSLAAKVRRISSVVRGLDREQLEQVRSMVLDMIDTGKHAETGSMFELIHLVSGGDSDFLAANAVPFLETVASRAARALGEISSPSCAGEYLRMLSLTESGGELLKALLMDLPRQTWFLALRALEEGAPGSLPQALMDLLGMTDRPGLIVRAMEACYRFDRTECLGNKADFITRLLEVFELLRAEDQRRVSAILVDRLAPDLSDLLRAMDLRRLSRLSATLDRSGAAKETGLYLVVQRELSSRREGMSASGGSAGTISCFWEGDVLYDGREAIASRARALEELLRKDLPAAADAISEAASHGDLSENAEYTAALERRDLLLARARPWQKELGRTKPYPEMDISDSVASPGTRVHLRRDTDEGGRLVYDLVGPLSSDVSEYRINYMAPLGTALLGKARGDVVTFPRDPSVEYVVEDIEVLEEVRRR